MFSVLFLTVIVLGVVKLQTSNLALSSTQNKTLEATDLANQSIEIVEAIGKTGIDTAGCMEFPCTRYLRLNGSNFELTQDVTAKRRSLTDNFDRTIQITQMPVAGNYQAVVLIEWEDSTGEHRKINSEGQTVNADVEAKGIIYQ